MKKLNFGMIGAGTMAGVMAHTFSTMEEVNAYAVAARDLPRAQTLADQHQIEKAYGSYEELLIDPNVDVVYISTPNAYHYEHTKMALLHGKHVLCEKAFTLYAAQAEELFALAKSKKLFLMEAIWTRFLPFVPKLKELLASGVIGEVCSLTACFGTQNHGMERLHLAALGGGALLDTGLYPLTFADLFFGSDVVDIQTTATLTKEGVDGQHSIILRYADGKLATLHSSVKNYFKNQAVIYGEIGYLEIDRFWQGEEIRVYLHGKTEPVLYSYPFDISGYEYEVRDVVRNIQAGKLESDIMPHAETLRMMRLYDSLRQKWGMSYPQEKQ